MKPVFFYGLFMDEDLLKQKGLHPLDARPAYVVGYGLRIGERATLEKSAGERSYGSVIQLSEDEIDVLYSEENVADYLPEEITTTDLNGVRMSALSYILPMEKLTGRNKEYAEALAVIAGKVGLPAEYIREIKSWIS